MLVPPAFHKERIGKETPAGDTPACVSLPGKVVSRWSLVVGQLTDVRAND
jgi:hypothetical protein